MWKENDIPTPSNKNSNEDYKLLAKRALSNGLSDIYSSNWTKVCIKDDVTIEEKIIPNSNINLIRTIKVIRNIDFSLIVKHLYSPTYQERKILYTDLIDYKIIENIDDNIHVSYSKFKMPFGVTDRDFLTVRAIHELDDGNCIIVIRSINRKDILYDPNAVRGISDIDIHCQVVDNGIIVVMVNRIDPKGWLPYAVINKFKKNAGDPLINMKNILQ